MGARRAAGSHVPSGKKRAYGLAQEKSEFEHVSVAIAKIKIERLGKKILAKYDEDKSGKLDRKELKRLLKDEFAEAHGEKAVPSDDDIQFLFKLCDTNRKADGKIDREEILTVCEAWNEFAENRYVVEEYVKKHDHDGDNNIDQEELQTILDEVNDGKPVPTEVVLWVLQESDLSKNGSLQLMEMTRALSAFRLWRDGRSAGPDSALGHGLAKDPNLPRAPSDSKCCVMS